MAWFVLTGLLGIILAGCLITFLAASAGETKAGAAALAGVGVVVWAFISILLSYNTVGQLQVGLVYNPSGTLQKSVSHGVVWLAPWESLKTENIGLQSEDFVLDSSNSAVSQDQQEIFANIQLNYEVEPNDVVHLFKTVGADWKSVLLESRMLQDFKQVTSTYTAAQITTERAALRADTKASMIKELSGYGVRVVDVLIKNIGYSATYQDAIQQKTIQVQKALQAEAKVSQSRAEAQQAVAIATGKAESVVLAAKAEAQALELKGQAIQRNPSILQLEAIDKLNPNASVIICTGLGSGNCPSFLPQAAAAK